jgi:hypothetical protein
LVIAARLPGGRRLLRHTVATLAYRGGRTLRDVPEAFAQFRLAEKGRTPVEILAQIGDLLDWALWLAKGKPAWRESMALPWAPESQRFFAALGAFDEFLASGAPMQATATSAPLKSLAPGRTAP